MNRILNDNVTAMLLGGSMETESWGEALRTACFVRNRSRASLLDGKTPHEVWTGRRPVVKHLRMFGCLVAVKLDNIHYQGGKYGPKCWYGRFVGYCNNS